MWIMWYNTYALSKGASLVSAFGALFRYMGVGLFFVCCSENDPALGFGMAAFCIPIGVGMHFWAEHIAGSKYKQFLQANGYLDQIKSGNMEVAVAVYNKMPCKATLRIIGECNARIALQLEHELASKKRR